MTKPKLIVFSGAGLSVESGISAFRGPNGLWNDHSIEDVCSFRSWRQNIGLVTRFYDDLRSQLEDKKPHSGFDTLHRLSEHYEVMHFTSNVDDLYEKSGLKCVHIHGELTKVMCMNCLKVSDIGYHSTHDAVNLGLICHAENCTEHLIKPAVTFYYENYYNYPGHSEFMGILSQISHNDTILVIGSSLNVIPVDYYLRHTRCYKYNINPAVNAGYKKDFRHWVNIKENAIPGLLEFEKMMERYRR